MAKARIRKRPISEINVVPYIDVMLVLLVIFMITAPLLTQGVKVELPQAPAEVLEQPEQEPLIVTIDAEGRAYLNYGDNQEDPIAPESLIVRVRALLEVNPAVPVLVRGDKLAAYGDVVTVMALLKRANVPGVGLMTKLPDQP